MLLGLLALWNRVLEISLVVAWSEVLASDLVLEGGVREPRVWVVVLRRSHVATEESDLASGVGHPGRILSAESYLGDLALA